MGTYIFWTDERVSLLRERWGSGVTASRIADELGQGATKNSVIGKTHRLGLGRHPGEPSKWTDEIVYFLQERRAEGALDATIAADLGISVHAARNKARRLGLEQQRKSERGAFAGLTHNINLKTAQATPSPALVPELPPQPRKTGGVSIFELTAHTCRWPIGTPGTKGFYFCGDEPGIGPYCREHGRQAYDPRFLPGR